MRKPTDRDGKSKTASAVDRDHYPEQNEVDQPESEEPDTVEHPAGKDDPRRAKINSQSTRKKDDESGSVQH